MAQKERKPYKNLTKEDLKMIMTLWDTLTVKEIAEKLDVTYPTIFQVARKMRDAGLIVLRKRSRAKISDLILKLKEEMSGSPSV